jgi:hypothetical protein
VTDWRLPENRREAFQRSYTFSLKTQSFPGMVYSMLPAVADAFDLDADGRAWLGWLNGNTQNVVTSMILLEQAPRWQDWKVATDFFGEHFKALEFDTDRRHQKTKFPEATEKWIAKLMDDAESPASAWDFDSGKAAFGYAMQQPYMGRISAWSYMEFVRILLPHVPDVDSWYLKESSSRSHRNALCLLAGYDDAWSWDGEQSEIPFMLDLLPSLHDLAEDLLAEARGRNYVLGMDYLMTGTDYDDVVHPDVSRLTLESALCTFKSWHKPDRRYPGVYADMMYQRIKKAETRMGRSLDLLWDIRKETLPEWLRLEDNPRDPGLSQVKQNQYRETGQIPLFHRVFDDMQPSQFDLDLANEAFAPRKDPKW